MLFGNPKLKIDCGISIILFQVAHHDSNGKGILEPTQKELVQLALLKDNTKHIVNSVYESYAHLKDQDTILRIQQSGMGLKPEHQSIIALFEEQCKYLYFHPIYWDYFNTKLNGKPRGIKPNMQRKRSIYEQITKLKESKAMSLTQAYQKIAEEDSLSDPEIIKRVYIRTKNGYDEFVNTWEYLFAEYPHVIIREDWVSRHYFDEFDGGDEDDI
jgi:hypothetical protein